jgi:1-acyl-sn-glycerol-3-phosphate acyltransferase
MRRKYSHFLYEMGHWISFTGLTWGFNYRFEGREFIPPTGPALLISNHQSFLDPSIVGCAARRHLCFLARKTLFRNRFFAALIHRLNAVPVDQEGVAKEGLKTILEELKAGQAVLVFPEGERTATGEIQALKPGILLLIKRMHAPIVPIGIAGAFDALPRSRHWPKLSPFFLPPTGADIAVSIGRPISPERYRDMSRELVLKELQQELQHAKQRAERLRRKT